MTGFTHTLNQVWKESGQTTLTGGTSFSGDTEINQDLAVGAGLTNVEFDVTIISDNVQSIYFLSDQDVTVKTNSTSVPDDTLNLKANIAIAYGTGTNETNPIGTATVTKFYVTNAGPTDATLKIRCVVNTAA